MSGKGNCYDNAMVETFFKTLKSELVWRTIFYNRQEADQAIGRYIDGFYNPVRRHSALDFTSPAQLEKRAAKAANASPLKRGKSPVHPISRRLRNREDARAFGYRFVLLQGIFCQRRLYGVAC